MGERGRTGSKEDGGNVLGRDRDLRNVGSAGVLAKLRIKRLGARRKLGRSEDEDGVRSRGLDGVHRAREDFCALRVEDNDLAFRVGDAPVESVERKPGVDGDGDAAEDFDGLRFRSLQAFKRIKKGEDAPRSRGSTR